MRLIPGLAALAFAAAAPAAEHFCGRPTPHPIDMAEAEAVQRSGGVTVQVREVQSQTYAAWDAELNRVYRELLSATPSAAEKETLHAAQRAWLAFHQAATRWDETAIMHGDEGTSGPINIAGAATTRLRARVCELTNDLDWVREHGSE